MLLPNNHEFINGLKSYYHVSTLHTGSQITLSLIREKFWFGDGRSVVRNQLRKCQKCFLLNFKASLQLMGDFPNIRIRQIRLFDIVGLHFLLLVL